MTHSTSHAGNLISWWVDSTKIRFHASLYSPPSPTTKTTLRGASPKPVLLLGGSTSLLSLTVSCVFLPESYYEIILQRGSMQINILSDFISFCLYFLFSTVTTWIGLVITLIVTSIALHFFVRNEGNYRENFVWAVLISLSLSTSQYGHYWPVKGGIKLFLATMLFYGLHINTAYHSYLINVLTNPRYDTQIDTVEEAMSAGLIFEVGENTVEYFKKEDDVG